MANRYSNYTPSAYNPLSLEEIAMVPAMKRKQHDQLTAANELIRSGLAKTDPLKEHEARAIELKRGIEGKMDTMATELATSGVNNDMIGKAIAFNREYQDLVSPTGDLGKINTSKIVYNKNKEEFLKSAEAQKIGRDRALELWGTKTKDYTGFDADNKILDVSPQGVAAYQDYEKDLSQKHSILGETVKGISTAGHHLEQNDDGTYWEVTRNGDRKRSNNTKQVEEAYQAFRDKWIAESGEGTKYSKDAGLGVDEARVRHDFNAMLNASDVTNIQESANYGVPPSDGTDKDKSPGVEGSEIDTVEVGAKEEDYSDIKNIGTIKYNPDTEGTGVTGEAGVQEKGKSKEVKFSHMDIKNPYVRKKYIHTYNQLRASKTIPGNVSADDPKAAALVQAAMRKQGPITLSSKVLTTDNQIENSGFPEAQIGKTNAERTAAIVSDLRTNKVRTFIDPEDGKEKNWNEMVDEGYDMKSIEYYGYMSPHSWTETKFGGKDKNVSQHLVTLKKTGSDETYTAEVSRSSKDASASDIKTSRALRDTYQEATIDPNEFVKFKTDNPRFKNSRVMYQTKDTKTGQPLSQPVFTIKFPDGRTKPMTEAQYIKFMYSEHAK